MKKQVLNICENAHFELKHIGSVRRFLTEDASKTLVTSYILSWLDYCSCLLMGTPDSVTNLSRKFKTLLQDSFLGTPPPPLTSPGKPALASHFIKSNVLNIKFACMCFSAINGSGPAYPLNCYMSTLCLVHYALLLTPAC